MQEKALIRQRKRALLAGLMAFSLLALFFPSSWTGQLMGLVQVLLPFQDAATRAVDSAAGALVGADDPVSAERYQQLQRKNQALQNRLSSMQLKVEQLEQDNSVLLAIRMKSFEGRSIGDQGRLIPARVVTGDITSWRESLLIDAGTRRGVRVGDAVTSRDLSLSQGANVGIRDGLAVLMEETFIGLVENTSTHTARVRLLSDVASEIRVRLGRFEGESFQSAPGEFWLTGKGGGRMVIHVEKRHVEDGYVRVGDLVLADPSGSLWPTALTVGKIISVETDLENPTLSILLAESALEDLTLRKVFVYDPSLDNPQ